MTDLCVSAGTKGIAYLVSVAKPVQDSDDETLVFCCPVEGCTATRKDEPASLNGHIRKKHATHSHLDIVYRACLLEDKPVGSSSSRGFVLTHEHYYQRCQGERVPIDPIHTLDPAFIAGKDVDDGSKPSPHKRQRGQAGTLPANGVAGGAEVPTTGPKTPSVSTPGSSRGQPPANSPSTGTRTSGQQWADAFSPIIHAALENGNEVEIEAPEFTLKFTPGKAGACRA